MKDKTVKLKLDIPVTLLAKLERKGQTIEDYLYVLLDRSIYKQHSSLTDVGILTRTYAYFKRDCKSEGELEYTKDEFIRYFLSDASFTKLFKKYKKSGFIKELMPSFKRHRKLKKVKVAVYKDMVNSKAVVHNSVTYTSIEKAIKATGYNRVEIHKMIIEDNGFKYA